MKQPEPQTTKSEVLNTLSDMDAVVMRLYPATHRFHKDYRAALVRAYKFVDAICGEAPCQTKQ